MGVLRVTTMLFWHTLYVQRHILHNTAYSVGVGAPYEGAEGNVPDYVDSVAVVVGEVDVSAVGYVDGHEVSAGVIAVAVVQDEAVLGAIDDFEDQLDLVLQQRGRAQTEVRQVRGRAVEFRDLRTKLCPLPSPRVVPRATLYLDIHVLFAEDSHESQLTQALGRVNVVVVVVAASVVVDRDADAAVLAGDRAARVLGTLIWPKAQRG